MSTDEYISKNQLIESNLKVALEITNSWTRKGLRAGVDTDDILGVALEGLVSAAYKFEGTNGASFETYVRRRIPGEILDYLREVKTSKEREMVVDFALVSKAQHRANHESDEIIRKMTYRNNFEAEDLLTKLTSVLSDKAAQLLRWRYIDGLSHEKISEKLGTSVETARGLLRYYRDKLRKHWQYYELVD